MFTHRVVESLVPGRGSGMANDLGASGCGGVSLLQESFFAKLMLKVMLSLNVQLLEINT